MNLEEKQKLDLIMSNIIMAGETQGSEGEKIDILNNSFKYLLNKMNWNEEQLNDFSKDIFEWLKSTRNYYSHFWDGDPDKKTSFYKKNEIEQKEYTKKIKDRKENHNFKNIVKNFILKNNLEEEIQNELFDISLLSIFLNSYEKDRIINNYKLKKSNDIYKILTIKNINKIYLYKFIKEKEYFLPSIFEVNEILYLLNSEKIKEKENNLSFLKKDLYKRIKNYFNKRNKINLTELESWKGYSISKNEKIFQIQIKNTKYLLNEKYLLNLFLLFCIKEKNPSFHWIKSIKEFQSFAFQNKECWENKMNAFKEKQNNNNIISFNNMMSFFYEKNKHKFIKHSLKFLHKYWKNIDEKHNLINIFQNINVIENIKKYIYHNNFQKLDKLLNNSEDYKKEFLEELNITKDKKIIESIYEYIIKNINKFKFKNKKLQFIEKNDNHLKIIRFHFGSKDLKNHIDNLKQIQWKNIKKGKSNKILLAYFYLLKELLKSNNKQKINKILLEKSILKDIKNIEERLSYSKKENKDEKQIIENRAIQQSQLFKSLYKKSLHINKENKYKSFLETIRFYRWYEKNEFILIDKVKQLKEKKWENLDKDEQEKQKIRNFIMHRKFAGNEANNFIQLKEKLEKMIK